MPPTISNLTSGSDATNLNVGGTYTTASVQANNNEVVIACVQIERSTLDPTAPTVSGGGVTTWNTLTGQVFDGSGTTRARQDLFWGVSDGSAATIVITVSDAATQNGSWVIDKIASGSTTTPFTQNKLGTQAGGTSVTATLDAAMDSNARPYAFVSKGGGTGAITPRTNWTELAETAATENEIAETQWRSDTTETTGSASWTGTNVAGIIVAEVAAGGQTVSPGLINQAGATFSPQVNISSTPGLIDQAGATFSPQINLSFSPALIDQTAQIFSPTVTVNQTVSPGLIDQTAQIFAPTLSALVTMGFIDQTAQTFAPTITGGAQSVIVSTSTASSATFSNWPGG